MTPELIDALSQEAEAAPISSSSKAAWGCSTAFRGPRRTGASADLRARLGLPVLLVIDVAGQSQSAAALVRGFASHDPRADRRRRAQSRCSGM